MKTLNIIVFIYICKLIDTYTFIDREKSYIRYNQWNASRNGTLRFKFKTYNTYGLLLYSDNSKTSNSIRNALVIKLSYAKLSVTIQMGSDDRGARQTMVIGEKLNNLEWHHVEVTRRKGRETTITLDKKQNIIINDGAHNSLDLNSGLYVGYVSDDMTKSKTLIDRTILAMPRFIGCIDNLEYSHSQSPMNFMSRELEKVEVENGCLNACENQSCPNHGRCINQFTKIKCDCIGTGYDGVRCTKEAESIQFRGREYITINVAGRLKSTPSNIIKFRFKTTYGDGVIFAALSGNDHLLIELYSNIIRLSIDLGGGFHISDINNIPFNNGNWHLVEIFRNGRVTSIRVDKKYCVNSSTPGMFSKLDMRDALLHIGGHPSKEILHKMNSQSKKNFTGCLQQVYYNGMDVIYKVFQIKSSRFKMNGPITKGCNVVKGKVIKVRENEVPSISKSGYTNVNHPIDITAENTTATPVPGETVVTQNRRVAEDDPNTLSRSTVVWITVGLVIGSIVLVITVGVIVHNVRHRYRAVLLSSSLKSLKENNNSLHRKFSSNDLILRGSTDRMIHGSSDRLMRSSTDRLIRGSTDRIMRGSTDRIMRGSTDRIMRGSTDRIMRGSTDRIMRGSTDRLMRGNSERMMRASTDRIPRVGGDRSQRRSVHGSIPAINERLLREKKERVTKPNAENNLSGRILNDIKDSPVSTLRQDSSTIPSHVA